VFCKPLKDALCGNCCVVEGCRGLIEEKAIFMFCHFLFHNMEIGGKIK